MSVSNILFSLFISVVSLSLVFGAFAFSPVMFLIVAMIGSGLAVVFALPVILLLRRLNILNLYYTLGAGFIVGAAPFAVWLYPGSGSSGSGVIGTSIFTATSAGQAASNSAWLGYGIVVLVFGIIGVLGASIFWAALTRFHRGEH